MHGTGNEEHRWGVILAGGDGSRLRPITRLVSDDDRPKQFCPLLDGKTLLAQTQLRIAGTVDPDRTLFVLNKIHEPFYREELARVPAIQKVVQPSNRGTLPAILWTLLRIARLDEHAVVAFFPSDHYYSQEGKFIAGITSGYELAELHAENIILLGSVAERPEIEYGWIEPETPVADRSGNQLTRVRRFWEKPSSEIAKRLLDQGCLWNTFVMVGRASAFLKMIRQTAPIIYRDFGSILTLPGLEMEAELMESFYERLPIADFSKLVLSANTEGLSVASLGDIGWSDLGDPRRLITTLFETGMENPWVSSGSCNQCGVSLA
jgi:mannose-1-phosphate guanylyltransferase